MSTENDTTANQVNLVPEVLLRCRGCGCLWRKHEATATIPFESVSLASASQSPGECCDNQPGELERVEIRVVARPSSSAFGREGLNIARADWLNLSAALPDIWPPAAVQVDLAMWDAVDLVRPPRRVLAKRWGWPEYLTMKAIAAHEAGVGGAA